MKDMKQSCLKDENPEILREVPCVPKTKSR